ncbi:MAG: Wzz/FepE/Etk N-terminal domain-containing protein [Colwellia sp.]|nr:Wzz/FepE/Etk N-terminal domain-containing protein [Colwellia sp.]MCW8864958.1 Wzz/FepE/Etk N-terminal domain-containing protein [Colwellia sp.]MCW9082873.1 Wzz/FepE/Etk N-terminal domain-containing protein [Colwellia sp.]
MLLSQMQQNQPQDDEIDLAELWRAIWAGKITIIAISFIFAVASIFFALSKPNIYKASAILAPASAEGGAGGLGALAGQFGGLASMAGINLGGGGADKTALALEIIKSRSFIETFIAKHDLLVPIMAAEKWDMATDTLILDDELYDEANKKWIREVSAPKKTIPSSWEAYKEFSELLSVSQDKTTAMVTVEIEYYSPAMAQQWLTWLIKDVNGFMREQDKKEAQDSINYLTKQLESIQVASMETVFYQLIEEQSKNMMLTQVKAEYVLKTIDPAQVPDEKASPKRALIVVLGTMLGGMLSVLIVLIRYFSNKEPNKKD